MNQFQIFYDSYEEAYAEAKKGKIWGFVYFAKNFTDSITQIRNEGKNADEGSFQNSEIQIHLDKSDQQLTFFLESKLHQTYKEFSEKLMIDCEFPVKMGNIPMDFMEPIYGSFDDEYTSYIAPGVVMT